MVIAFSLKSLKNYMDIVNVADRHEGGSFVQTTLYFLLFLPGLLENLSPANMYNERTR